MANKKALVETVREAILKAEPVADNQRNVHYRRVEAALGYAFDTILSQIRLDDGGKSKISQYYVKNYYNQPVRESNGYRYVGISDSIIPIGEGKGIWYVQPSGGGEPLSQSKRPSTSLFRSLPVGDVMNETVWSLANITTKPQIVLENIGDSSLTDIRFIDYGIVRGFDSYGEDEEIIIPDGRMDLIMSMSLGWFQARYNDSINNNE